MLNKVLIIYQPPTTNVEDLSCFSAFANKTIFSASTLHHFHHRHTH